LSEKWVPHPGRAVSLPMGALRTQEPRISGRRRLNTPPFPEIGGSGDVFPHLRDRGSPSQSYADGDIPLTGSHGLPGVKRVRSIFGHSVRVNDRSRVSSGRDWNIHMRTRRVTRGSQSPGPTPRSGSNDLHRFWENSYVGHAVNMINFRGSFMIAIMIIASNAVMHSDMVTSEIFPPGGGQISGGVPGV
jgi:hypothetical protein